MRTFLNVPNVRPLADNIADLQTAVATIQGSSIGDFGPPVADITMNGYRLIDVADPINDTDVATKQYVDGPLQALETNVAGHEERIVALETVPPATQDTAARTAIGFPYNHVESLDVRTGANFNDIAIMKGQIGLPYYSTFSIEHRLNALEAEPGQDDTARAAIGWPYNTQPKGTVTQRLVDWENSKFDIYTRISDLDSAISMPYTGTNIKQRLTQNETNITTNATDISGLKTAVGIPYTNALTLQQRVFALEAKMDYFVGQGMIRAGDVGGSTFVSNPLPVSGIIKSATRTLINQGPASYMTMNWDDPGFNVIPIIVWFNDVSSSITDSSNNDLSPVWLSANNLTRTQCRVYLEENPAGGTQNVRLFVLLYRCDQNILIN